MTRSFSPADVWRLRHEQASGTWLELEDELLLGGSLVRRALFACRPWGSGAVHTLLQDAPESGGTRGVVQCRRRVASAEGDLLFVAPGLDQGNGAALTWQRLFTSACQCLAARGVERVYAAVPEGDGVALQVLRQIGFVLITGDVVYRRDSAAGAGPPPTLRLTVPGGPADAAVVRLAEAGLPPAMRAHLPASGGDWSAYPLGGHNGGAVTGRVWLDDQGEVVGAWRAVAGRSAIWLRLLVRPGADASPLVRAALHHVRTADRGAGRPLYAAARGYEPEVHLALLEAGFRAEVRRFRLVKHTAARVLAPAWPHPAARDASLDVAASPPVRLQQAARPSETVLESSTRP